MKKSFKPLLCNGLNDFWWEISICGTRASRKGAEVFERLKGAFYDDGHGQTPCIMQHFCLRTMPADALEWGEIRSSSTTRGDIHCILFRTMFDYLDKFRVRAMSLSLHTPFGCVYLAYARYDALCYKSFRVLPPTARQPPTRLWYTAPAGHCTTDSGHALNPSGVKPS